MKSLRYLLVIAPLVLAAPQLHAKDMAHAPASTAKPSEQAQVEQAFDSWLLAVNSGSSEAVMKLYEKDAVLLPTLSPKVHNTPELRKDYFNQFTSKPNIKGTVNEKHIRVFRDIAINSGLYTFTFTKDGETVSVPARFSFVYHKTPHGWLIVDHHSSRLPEVK